MSRWYKVVLTDGRGNYKDFTTSGNTRKSSERSARSRLKEEIGEEFRKWWTSKIVPAKVSPETGRPEGL